MDSKEIYDSKKELWEEFDSKLCVFVEKGKQLLTCKEKPIGEIKKLVTEYRKASVA